MELHYLTLKRQSEFLSAKLTDAEIQDSYTQKKNEQTLLIKTVTQNLLELVLSTDPALPFILLRPAQKRARLSTRVIPDVVDKRISKIEIAQRDRVISIYFMQSDLIYKCQFFRNNSNFFLVDHHDRILSTFKHNQKHRNKIYHLQESKLLDPLQINRENLSERLNKQADILLSQFLKNNFFYITPVLLQEISVRTDLNLDVPLQDLKSSYIDDAFQQLREVITACQSDLPRVYIDGDYPIALGLTALQIFQKYSCHIYETINEALIYFIFHRLKQDRKRKQVESITTVINKKLSQIDNWITHLANLPDELIQRKKLQRVGELILAQLHQIPSGVSTAEITDLFEPQQPRVSVKLDGTLSARENAELYFQKARAVSDQMRKKKENLRHLQRQQKQLYHYQELIQGNPADKVLSQIENKLIESRIMQTDDERMQEIYRPYRSYLYENWEIWVGKSAKDNDQLTFHWAHKEDFWLHAQGVSGSHVIIRKTQRKQDPPKSVLEYAARLAAGNSQARTSSYVPVIYTRVKYLRKPRGSEAGAVIPERTKSIFVEPLVK